MPLRKDERPVGTPFDMTAQYQRITKHEIGNRLFRVFTEDEEFKRVLYEEVSFLRRHFTGCRWLDCRFTRTHFRHGTRFESCLFQGCKFDRAHTYIGGPSFFSDCKFERCSFSSKFTNVVFYGPDAPTG